MSDRPQDRGLVAVRTVNTAPAAEHGADFTVLTSAAQNPVQLLLGRDYYRARAVVLAVDQPVVLASSREAAAAAANAGQVDLATVQNFGQVTDPGAFGAIVLLAAPGAGLFRVRWTVGLAGTVAAADVNNFQLQVVNVATVWTQSVNPGAAGTYAQPDAVISLQPGQELAVVAVGAASGAAAVYSAQLSLEPLGGGVVAAQGPSGAYLPAGQAVTIDNCDEHWLAACSATLGRVSVWVSRTAETDAAEAAAEELLEAEGEPLDRAV